MPDFTIEIKQQCGIGPQSVKIGDYLVTGLFDETSTPSCKCLAYKYSKPEQNGGKKYCKHIKQAEDKLCGWHELYSSEKQVEDGICPRCGGKTYSVRVAV